MKLAEVLPIIRPGAVWSISGDEYDGLIWQEPEGGQSKPSQQEVEAALLAYSYSEKRRREYPSLTDQLDAIWKGGAAVEEMRQRVMAVKDKYPKGE